MPQPPAYYREKDFTENFGSETDHSALNAELDKVSNSVNDIRTNLAVIQADDGKIRQSAITTDSLSTTVTQFLIEEVSGGITGFRDDAIAAAAAAKQSENNAASSKNAAAQSAVNAAASAASVQTYIDHVSKTDNPHQVTKAQVGLGNADNTSDVNKPVSIAMQNALNLKVSKTGDAGAAYIPGGTSAQRPALGTAQYGFRYNQTTLQPEFWNGSSWGSVGNGAVGAPGNPVFYENDTTITGDYTITNNKNAMTAGPVTVAGGVVVTVNPGSVWTIV